jgi:crotonobetaine/carnitine-CoA ligase
VAREKGCAHVSIQVNGAQTVASLLTYRAFTAPQAPFIVFDPLDSDPRELTYRDTWECAVRAAQLLSWLGLKHGERFAVVLENSPEFFTCWFAAALSGTVMVPVNPASTADDLQYYFDHAECRAVVCSTTNREAVEKAWCGTPSAIVTVDDAVSAPAAPTPAMVETPSAPRDPLAVMYTSGTTSRPKGVVVTHANYLTAGYTVANQLRIRPDDRWLVTLPLFHANAQYYCAMSALASGASLVVSARFSASRWAHQAHRHGATLASLFAAPIRMILASPQQRPEDGDNHLRAAIFAQNLTDEQAQQFERRFGAPLLQIYGMTETIAPPLMNPLYGPVDNQTIGVPTASNRVRIVDASGADVGKGQVGEILIGGIPGETLMAGYLADEQATAEAIVDGWLHTGDMAEQRSDGYVIFKDRAKDMIKRSGENVAAAEVERVINMHPGVFESAVIGIPDPIRDEAIKAFVVRHDDSAATPSDSDLIAFGAANLPRGKAPDVIEFVTELPRTSVGKIRKHVLRQSPAPTAPDIGG